MSLKLVIILMINSQIKVYITRWPRCNFTTLTTTLGHNSFSLPLGAKCVRCEMLRCYPDHSKAQQPSDHLGLHGTLFSKPQSTLLTIQ